MYSFFIYIVISGIDFGVGSGEYLKKIQVKVKFLIRFGNILEIINVSYGYLIIDKELELF